MFWGKTRLMKSEIKGDRESEGVGKKLTDKADHPGDMHTHTWSEFGLGTGRKCQYQ